MNAQNICMLICFLALFIILWLDLYFLLCNKVIYFTNQQHVLIYTIPLTISTLFLLFAQNIDAQISIYEIIVILLEVLAIIYLCNKKRIVLVNAKNESVINSLDKFLSTQDKRYKIVNSNQDNVTMVEINNLKEAIVVRDTGKWIEIDSNLSHDKRLLENLDNHFKNEKSLEYNGGKPNVFFYILNIILLLLMVYFVFFTPRF